MPRTNTLYGFSIKFQKTCEILVILESRLMAELQQVLGDRPPAYADLEQLPYLQVGVRYR
jgi:hypothetical protein